MLNTKNILGIKITDANESDILEYLLKIISSGSKKCKIFTPNPEIIVYANKHQAFKNLLNSAEISFCDGMGILVASYILGKPLKQRLTGTDFVKRLCEMVSEKPITVGFLGGEVNVAELTSKRLKEQYPTLKVVYVDSGNPDEETAIKISKKKIKIDILFVAFGFPKQEEWITNNIDNIPVRIAMGVGGAFDYISGNVKRAPFLIRFFGFEWLYRLIIQPWRIKRQFALVIFIFLVIKARL